jgi:hypothetical protein
MYNLKLWRLVSNNPDSNTGLDSQLGTERGKLVEARIDALTILWTFSADCLVDRHLEDWLGIKLDMENSVPRKIGVLWDYSHVSPTGSIYCLRHAEHGRIACRLALSGEDCGRLGNARLRGFMVWADKNLLNLKCSRLDLAIDDYSKKMQFQQIEDAIKGKNRSGFRNARTVRNHQRRFGGWTVYLGARQSEFMARIYDKFAESKGLIDSHRWEAEIKGDTANALFPLLLEFPASEEGYQAKLIDYAIGKIKFIECIDKNIARCPLLSWWSDWLEFLSCVPKAVFVARFKPSLARTKQWLQKSVAKSLAMISDSLGAYYFPHFLEELLISGRERMQDIDKLRVEDYKGHSHSYGDLMNPIKIQLVTQ